MSSKLSVASYTMKGGLLLNIITSEFDSGKLSVLCELKNYSSDSIIFVKDFNVKGFDVNSEGNIRISQPAVMSSFPSSNFYKLSKKQKNGVLSEGCKGILGTISHHTIPPGESMSVTFRSNEGGYSWIPEADSFNISLRIAVMPAFKDFCPLLWTGQVRRDSIIVKPTNK